MINLYTFLIGSTGYGIIEILWRGYTHISMLITGGVCFILMYNIATYFKEISLPKKSLLSGLCITAVELCVGFIVNIKLNLNVWDYSSQPLNLSGQICPLYTTFWIFLSLLLIKLIDFIKEKKHITP